jgi:hypothetical protein
VSLGYRLSLAVDVVLLTASIAVLILHFGKVPLPGDWATVIEDHWYWSLVFGLYSLNFIYLTLRTVRQQLKQSN